MISAFTVAGTAPDFRRLPFEPPPPNVRSWAAPWSTDLLGEGPPGCQIGGARIMQAPMTANHTRFLAILAAIVTAAALRLVPHPPNFTPIGAMALFGGAYLGRRALAFAAPLAALLLSDALIGFHTGMAFVYASVALIVVIGWIVLQRRSLMRIAGAAVASSVL